MESTKYQTRKRLGVPSKPCGALLTTKKGLVSMVVSAIQCTAFPLVALVIRATDSLSKHKFAIIESRNTTNKTRRPSVGTTRNGANHSQEVTP